jgi:hypothetical protein
MSAKRVTKTAAPVAPERKLRGRLVPVTVGMQPELVKLLDAAASRERRSRNNLIDTWLADRLEQEGYSLREA